MSLIHNIQWVVGRAVVSALQDMFPMALERERAKYRSTKKCLTDSLFL